MNSPVVDVTELRERGWTVVRGFLDASSCQQARAAMDREFGVEPTEQVDASLLPHPLGHASQAGSGAYRHSVCHPNPALAAVAQHTQRLVDVHCQVLRSDPACIRLNGQSMIRSDPWLGDQKAVNEPGSCSG